MDTGLYVVSGYLSLSVVIGYLSLSVVREYLMMLSVVREYLMMLFVVIGYLSLSVVMDTSPYLLSWISGFHDNSPVFTVQLLGARPKWVTELYGPHIAVESRDLGNASLILLNLACIPARGQGSRCQRSRVIVL